MDFLGKAAHGVSFFSFGRRFLASQPFIIAAVFCHARLSYVHFVRERETFNSFFFREISPTPSRAPPRISECCGWRDPWSLIVAADKGRAAFEMIYLIVAFESGKSTSASAITTLQCHHPPPMSWQTMKSHIITTAESRKKMLKTGRENSFYDYQ